MKINAVKKILYILLFMTVTPLISQNNILLPLETGIWKQENVYCEVQSYEENGETLWHRVYNRYYYNIYSIGDTLIDNTSYLLLKDIRYGLTGAIRQDSNKVYYRHYNQPNFNNEVVLYDFNINVDDTFRVINSHNEEMQFFVINIDTVNIQGINRKRIKLEIDDIYQTKIYWIEGVGSTGGLLHNYYPTEIPTCDACCGVEDNLVCLTNNDNLLFLKDNYYDCDSLLQSIQEVKQDVDVDFKLKSNILTIETNTGNYINFIEIYDLNGRLVLKQKANKQNNISIPLNNRGVNVVKVYSKLGVKTKKIVIVDF